MRAVALRRAQTALVFGSGFGTANSDRVVVTDVTSIQNFTAFTMIGWWYNQSSGSWIMMQKGVGSDNSRKQLTQSGSTGNVQLLVDRATTDSSYITNDTPTATVNRWYLVAATYDESATPTTHIYTGSLVYPAVESTYGTSNNGSGGTRNDSAHDLVIGNLELANSAFHGRIGPVAYYNRALSLAEIREWQLRPQSNGSRVFMRLGLTGTSTQLDLSGNGNHGTVTGALMAQGLPLRQPRQDEFLAEIAAAATTGTRMSLTGVGF